MIDTSDITSDSAIRRVLTVQPVKWFKTERGHDGCMSHDDQGTKVSFFVDESCGWARPLVGRVDLQVSVRTWRLNKLGLFNADLMPIETQPEKVRSILGHQEFTGQDFLDGLDPELVAEAIAKPLPCDEPPTPSRKAASKLKASRKGLTRNVQSGSCKAPSERAEPLKFSLLTQNMAEANLLWNSWLKFQQATNNTVGHSTFISMCALEGVQSVLRKFDQ